MIRRFKALGYAEFKREGKVVVMRKAHKQVWIEQRVAANGDTLRPRTAEQ